MLTSFKNWPEKYNFTVKGTIENYLGVKIVTHQDRSFEMRQPFLIKKIVDFIEMSNDTNPKDIPLGKSLMHKDLLVVEQKQSWNYRSAVGMLNYLQNSTRPDIAMSVHQCARFNNQLMLSHERAIKRIAKYLKGTSDWGIVYHPDKTKGIECYVDADFAGGWYQADANNPENVMSRTGYAIYYAGCPVLWSSKLQTEIVLSTTDLETR